MEHIHNGIITSHKEKQNLEIQSYLLWDLMELEKNYTD